MNRRAAAALLISGAVVLGALTSGVIAAADPQDVHRTLCVASSSFREEALAAIGEDILDDAVVNDDCESRTPQALRSDFDPTWPALTATIVRSQSGVEPEYSATIVVVERNSKAYERAARLDFLVDATYDCVEDNCAAVGYEVYVTPDQLGTKLVDELVAIAFGIPRSVCEPPTPEWMQTHAGCDGGS